MELVNILRGYGLFDTKVPRYTSYPPANRFEANLGARKQATWLAKAARNTPVSVYVHIPFCRRLCWFCACRTQGTETLQPVDAYVADLVVEIDRVAGLTGGTLKMARLHLGGGTPTLLDAEQMSKVLDAIDRAFARASNFEFSVEIDPNEVSPDLIELLAARGMRRASIGVQDFDPKVQDAIGRRQSYDQTRQVTESLRAQGIASLNIDVLYGLPFQSSGTLQATLQQVHTLEPDRLALYGYAHVPHMAKRQVMIPNDCLPGTQERFFAAESARRFLIDAGYDAVGIDHFARPSDSLARAAKSGTLKRNFQGYTDDPCSTLIGFGASAISKFEQGFVQNAVATAAYQSRIRDGLLAAHKGYKMGPKDFVISDIVDQIMCYGQLNAAELSSVHRSFASDIQQISRSLLQKFPLALEMRGGVIKFRPGLAALTRIVAAHVDTALHEQHLHSAAI